MSVPAHWPQNIRYINTSCFHSSVSEDTRRYIVGSSRVQRNEQVPVVLVAVRRISSVHHPAASQFGLFAKKKIPARTWIINYVGEIHCEERADSDYDLSLYRSQDGVNVGVDASRMGNEARFINDYRGIQDRPNALFVDGRNAFGELRMSVWSGEQDIKKGEEILVSYGKSWWRSRSIDTGRGDNRPLPVRA